MLINSTGTCDSGCGSKTEIGTFDTLVRSSNAVYWALILVVAASVAAPWLLILLAELKMNVSPYAIPVLLAVILAIGIVLIAMHLDSFRDLVFVAGKEKFGNSNVYAALVVLLLILPTVVTLMGVMNKRPPLLYAGAGLAGLAGFLATLVIQPKVTLQAHEKTICKTNGKINLDKNSHFGSLLITAGFGGAVVAAVGVSGVFVLTKYAPVAALR